MNRTAVVCTAIATLGVVYSASLLSAGPLSPPAGPVASTYKTLGEVEPRTAINAVNTPGDAGSLFKITQPGSYYLTSNITGVSGKNGILIAASGVTIDLGGFEITGSAGTITGIRLTGEQINITIRNGSVRNWAYRGIDLYQSTYANQIISNISCSGCAQVGILVAAGSTVRSCSAVSNGNYGISINYGSVATDCTCTNNGGIGIDAASDCTVADCSCVVNGSYGISAGDDCLITRCVARDNSLDGITVNDRGVIRDNDCSSNGTSGAFGAGITTDGIGTRIEGNNCINNHWGIRTFLTGHLIFSNSSRGNTAGNYNIAAGSRVGTVIVAPVSGAVVGNSGAAGLGAADPTANYAY